MLVWFRPSVIVPVVAFMALIGGPSAGSGQTPAPAGGRERPQAVRDAREVWPQGMIGTWLLNVEKSRFTGPPLKSAYRTFDFTIDGQVLITWQTVSQEGNYRFGHWFMNMEGSEGSGMERTRATGAIPTNVAYFKQTDPNTLAITAKKNGVEIWLGSFKVSEDGKILYWKLKSTGAQTETDWVYEKAPSVQ